MDSDDVERYLAYMSDDITDYHAAYGVTLEGKDVFRRSFPEKARSSITYRIEVENVIVGSNVAVVEYKEAAKSKEGDTITEFLARTIMVLEFEDTGLIKHMRRYLD